MRLPYPCARKRDVAAIRRPAREVPSFLRPSWSTGARRLHLRPRSRSSGWPVRPRQNPRLPSVKRSGLRHRSELREELRSSPASPRLKGEESRCDHWRRLLSGCPPARGSFCVTPATASPMRSRTRRVDFAVAPTDFPFHDAVPSQTAGGGYPPRSPIFARFRAVGTVVGSPTNSPSFPSFLDQRCGELR